MKHFLILILFLTTLLITTTSFPDEIIDLSQVDMIRVSAHVQDGILNVSVLYYNRDQDKLVFWKRGNVTCRYEIYTAEGGVFNQKKDMLITNGYKELNRFSQDFYVDIPETYFGEGKSGIIECEVDINYNTLRASADFSLKK